MLLILKFLGVSSKLPQFEARLSSAGDGDTQPDCEIVRDGRLAEQRESAPTRSDTRWGDGYGRVRAYS